MKQKNKWMRKWKTHQAGFPAKGNPANKAARIPMQINS